MGRRDDFKGSGLENSRYLQRWDSEPERQDSRETYERDVQRAAQDVQLAERHAGFDLQAQDNTPKSARASFSVTTPLGERYRENFDKIDWSK